MLRRALLLASLLAPAGCDIVFGLESAPVDAARGPDGPKPIDGPPVCTDAPCFVDEDNDTVPDDHPDNCPTVKNKNQNDFDSDGVGDLCEESDREGVPDRIVMFAGFRFSAAPMTPIGGIAIDNGIAIFDSPATAQYDTSTATMRRWVTQFAFVDATAPSQRFGIGSDSSSCDVRTDGCGAGAAGCVVLEVAGQQPMQTGLPVVDGDLELSMITNGAATSCNVGPVGDSMLSVTSIGAPTTMQFTLFTEPANTHVRVDNVILYGLQ